MKCLSLPPNKTGITVPTLLPHSFTVVKNPKTTEEKTLQKGLVL